MALRNTYFESNKVYEPLPIPEQPGYTPPSPPTPPDPDPGSSPVVPRPSFSGSVALELYTNSTENNALDKSLSSVFSDTCVFKNPVDMRDPDIIVQTSSDLTGINYMKLGDKYYFAHAECITGGRYNIKGHIDVLMTYKDAIRSNTGIIRRNIGTYNRYLADERVKLNAYEQVKTLVFSGGFSKAMQYYLVAIGSDTQNGGN